MKKQLISLIFLSIFLNAENEKTIDENDKKLIVKDKVEKLNKLSLFLGKKEISTKMKNPYSSSNSYSKASDLDVVNYKKVSLMDVVLETVSTSDLLKASREKVIQNELKLRDAIAGYYPTLNFEYGLGRTQATNTDEDSTNAFKYYNDENYKLILNQNLYSGGSTNHDVNSLKKKLDLTKNQYYLVLSEQVTKAIKAYFDVVFSYKTVMTSESNMKNLNKILDIVTIKYDNGAASIGDLTAIKANVSNAKTQQIKVKSKFIESLRYYEYIVGEVYLETLPYEKNFNINISSFDLLYERALKRNKELVNYYESIEAEKFNLKSKESKFLPKVDLEFSVDNVIEQEDVETRERDINGLVKLSYNLYNGGRDKNKVLSSYSSIRELNFKLDEEKRKLKWNVSKLFTAINSTNESLKSNITEVISLRKMVEAYWEEFKLGDQDLQVLLQGQKQLNSAELTLISYEKNNITDLFTLLRYTGDLLAFFDIDPAHPKFIDFSKSAYTQEIYIDDKFLNEKEKIERQEELESQEKIKDALISKALQEENIIKFLSKFLSSNDEYYTIDIGLFDNLLKANYFIKSNNFDKEAFSYDVVDDLDINTKVTYGIYKTKKSALNQLDRLKDKGIKKELKIIQVKNVKRLYNEYLKGLKVKIKPVPPEIKIIEKTNIIEKIKQVKQEEKFNLNKEFEAKFLSADSNYYTINITSFNDIKELEDILIEKIELYDNTFAYNYFDSTESVRWIYGIYKTYDEAEKTINSLGEIKTKYHPVIQKIAEEQANYNLNIDLNLEIKEPELDYEYIKVSSKTVYKDPVSLKDIDLSKDKDLKGLVESFFAKVGNLFKDEPKKIDKVEKIEDEKVKIIVSDEINSEKIDVLEEEVNVQDNKSLYESEEYLDFVGIDKYNNQDFKSKFLNSPRKYYSILLATINNEAELKYFLSIYNLEENIFNIRLLNDKKRIKVMYGIFENDEEANKKLNMLPEAIININRAKIEKIYKIQDAYKENYSKFDLVKDVKVK